MHDTTTNPVFSLTLVQDQCIIQSYYFRDGRIRRNRKKKIQNIATTREKETDKKKGDGLHVTKDTPKVSLATDSSRIMTSSFYNQQKKFVEVK